MKRVRMTNGKYFTVSDIDYSLVRLFRWYQHKRGYPSYSGRINGVPFCIPLHQFLLGIRVGKEVAHKNRNKLDNRRENLRWATRAQNARNRAKFRGESKYVGVSIARGRKINKWVAQTSVGGKRVRIGAFNTERAAAEAYNSYVRRHLGKFAWTNRLSARITGGIQK